MATRFAANPYYVEYETQLKALNRLMADGRGDTDEADALREAMDRSVRELTREEVERLSGLSADLYMLQDEEIYEPLEPGEDPSTRKPEQLRARLAAARENAEATLILLRKGAADLSQSQRAYLRARAYEELGHLDTALLFMRNAAERDPNDSYYKWGALSLLDRTDQRDELCQRASEYLLDEACSPELRVYAAGLLFRLTRGQARERATSVFELVIGSLEATLPLLNASSSPLLPDLPAYGQLTLGFCYQRSGRLEDALNAFDQAMRSPLIRAAALVARGGLLLDMSNPEKALTDFEEAIASNTPLVAPYLYLAHHTLTRGDYERCLLLCDRALNKTRDPRLQAVVLQWEAIAGIELGASMEQVRRAFDVALTLDPLNPEIQHNIEVFRQQEQTGSDSAPLESRWQPPAAPEIQTADLLDPLLPAAA